MDPVGLGELLAKLPQHADADLLVGFNTSDDAGVYRLTDQLALITTVDFITPPVDDPYLFGQIAAANALSDIYAMGGRPITCLNLVAFPSRKLAPEVLHQIVAGALSKIAEAGAVLAGGHSIEDDEPKFGLAVNGLVHPQRYWTNVGALPDDVLILTKPIGSGVIFNANIRGKVSAEAMAACLRHLTTLNRVACETMQAFAIHAATDVTGFGLAGHGSEMAGGRGITLEIEMDRLPILPEALDLYRRGITTGANANNRRMVGGGIRLEGPWPSWQQEIVFDPQTSGGLLVAVASHAAEELLAALRAAGVESASIIGRVCPPRDGLKIHVI